MLMPGTLGCSEFHSVGGLLFRVDIFQMVKLQNFTFVVDVHVHTRCISSESILLYLSSAENTNLLC